MGSSRLLNSLGTTDEMAGVFSDASVLEALVRFEIGLAAAQARMGLIPAAAADTIRRAAQGCNLDPCRIASEARASATVALPFVKALKECVSALDESAAAFVHWGTTSQDATDTAMSLLLKRAREILSKDHVRLDRSLRALSDEHAGTVMIGRTLLQPAVPITFGLKTAGWYAAITRSWRRLSESFDEAAVLQFGGAAGTLASYGELGRELDLPVPAAPWHAHRDRMTRLVAECGIYTAALGKMARDISLLMQKEVGEISEAGGASSAMPHKRNPAGSVIALAAATRVPGLVSAYLTGMVQEHERAAGGWQAEWATVSDVIQATASALDAMVGVFEGITVYPERMRANLGTSDIQLGAAEEFRRRLLES